MFTIHLIVFVLNCYRNLELKSVGIERKTKKNDTNQTGLQLLAVPINFTLGQFLSEFINNIFTLECANRDISHLHTYEFHYDRPVK